MTPAKQRLFFALWPDEGVRARLGEAAQALAALGGGRATRPESIHVTLAFLGYVDAERLPALHALAEGIRGEPFRLVVDRLDYWRHNRIAWAGASTTPPPLARLASLLGAGLKDLGIPLEARPYVPHVTLVRDAACAALPALIPIEWRVDDFVLVQSVPGQSGSRYEVVGRWKLFPPAPDVQR
jgi:RNA 2',3'-cyclic 3'-phosphodiesterase